MRKLILVSSFLFLISNFALGQTSPPPETEAHEVNPELEKIKSATEAKTATQSLNDVCLRKTPKEARSVCCSPVTKLDSQACLDALIKSEEQAAAPKQFTSSNPKAMEAYTLVYGCLQSGSGQSVCSDKAQDIRNSFAKERNICFNANAADTDQYGRTSCGTCKNYYKNGVASGDINIFSASCGGSCQEITPGGNESCENSYKQKDGEVSAAIGAAVAVWNSQAGAAQAVKAKAQALLKGVKQAVEAAEKESAKKPPVIEKKAVEQMVAPAGEAKSAEAPRFKLIETFNEKLIRPLKEFFRKLFRLGR